MVLGQGRPRPKRKRMGMQRKRMGMEHKRMGMEELLLVLQR